MALANEPKVRSFGGYVWLPQISAMRQIADPRRRATILRRAISAVQLLLAELYEALDDTAVELRDEHRLTFDAIAVRCGMSETRIHDRIQRRRAVLAGKEAAAAQEAA